MKEATKIIIKSFMSNKDVNDFYESKISRQLTSTFINENFKDIRKDLRKYLNSLSSSQEKYTNSLWNLLIFAGGIENSRLKNFATSVALKNISLLKPALSDSQGINFFGTFDNKYKKYIVQSIDDNLEFSKRLFNLWCFDYYDYNKYLTINDEVLIDSFNHLTICAERQANLFHKDLISSLCKFASYNEVCREMSKQLVYDVIKNYFDKDSFFENVKRFMISYSSYKIHGLPLDLKESKLFEGDIKELINSYFLNELKKCTVEQIFDLFGNKNKKMIEIIEEFGIKDELINHLPIPQTKQQAEMYLECLGIKKYLLLW